MMSNGPTAVPNGANPLRLHHKTKVTFEKDSIYLMDGIMCQQEATIALSTSSELIKCYDVNTMGHIRDITGHNQPISDIVVGQNPNVIYSIQRDTGVMITDLRVGKPIHYLVELTNSGKDGYTISVNSNDQRLAIAAGGDIHIVDTATWCSVSPIEALPSDDITRLRYCSDRHLCTAGEDQLINMIDTTLEDDDMMMTVINCGESSNKMRWYPQFNAVTMTGTCESGFIVPCQSDAKETHIPRRDFQSYVVDFVDFNNALYLVQGHHSYEDDAPQQPMDMIDAMTGQVVGQLVGGHEDQARVVLRSRDRIVTAGEDGVIAFWTSGEQQIPTNHDLKQRPRVPERQPMAKRKPYG